MFFLNFVIFFNSESSSTYFKDSCISLQKNLIDEIRTATFTRVNGTVACFSLAVNSSTSRIEFVLNMVNVSRKIGFYSQSHFKTCLFSIDIQSKYIFPINKGSKKQMFIHLKGNLVPFN